MATHSSTLAWKIPWMEEPGRLQSRGSLRVGNNWVTSLLLFTFMHWRRQWTHWKPMNPLATHSSVLSWRIPGMGEPGGLPSMGSHRVEHNWSDLAATAANSVQFSSVVSDSLWSHELQQARPPCPSPTPGVYLNSCPSSQWCYPAISSSVIPFSSCPQSLPASGSFLMSQLFTGGDVPLEKPICRSGSNS